MKILDKTIVSNQQPTQTNVLWLDTNSNELKIFKNGSWQNLTSSGGSTVPEWALQPNPPSLNDLNAVGDEYEETSMGSIRNTVVLNNCEFPTSTHTLSELSEEQVEFVRYIVDKVINNNVEELKLKCICLADDTYYTPISVTCNTYPTGGMIIVTGYQGSQFDINLGPDYITTLSIQARIDNQELIAAEVSVTRIPARVAVGNSGEGAKRIWPNTFCRFTTPQTSLHITLGAPENDTIVNEYMFEFVSGSTPTSLSISVPPGYPAIKWVEDWTPEANKIYQVSILNGIGLVISVDNE